MRYRLYATRIKLYDSHLVSKRNFAKELDKIRGTHPSCRLWARSEGSIRREWAAHNLAYALGINREKTEDCDLEFEPRWYHNLLYGVVGAVALLLIK